MHTVLQYHPSNRNAATVHEYLQTDAAARDPFLTPTDPPALLWVRLSGPDAFHVSHK